LAKPQKCGGSMPSEGNIKKAVSQNVANDVPLNEEISQTQNQTLFRDALILL
jgi:hypothetical protein